MHGKIAIEEHFVTPALEDLIANPGWAPDAFRAVLDRLGDVDGERVEQMDRHGIEVAVLSLGANGIQDEPDPVRAVQRAREANDALAATVAARPDRFSGFAAVALQDPAAAADEAERAVHELGLKGVLVNGYTSLGDLATAAYYDEARFEPFWARVEALGVPLYLPPARPPADAAAHLRGPPGAAGADVGVWRRDRHACAAADHERRALDDTVPISEGDRAKIGRDNAARLLGL
jgi:gamma-resorcylate decarboxylase